MNTRDDARRLDDPGTRLRTWMRSSVPTREPAGLISATIVRTLAIRQRPAAVARLGLPIPWPTIRDLSRWARLVLVAGLLLIGIGAAASGGARLLAPPLLAPPLASPPLTFGPWNSLIVLTPDLYPGQSGTIRVLRPDGLIVGQAQGSTNGCRRTVLGPDGQSVAFAYYGPPVTIASLNGSDPVTVNPAHSPGTGWVFSPDRTRFAYLDGTADRADLTIVSLVDGTSTVIARDLRGASLFPWSSWSVNDTLAIGLHNGVESGVDVIAADGTNHRPLWREPVDGRAVGDMVVASWSPDGTRLLYARGVPDLLPETLMIDVATGRSTLLATTKGRPVNPWINSFGNGFSVTWSPDGRLVSYQVENQQALLDVATGESRILPGGVDARAWHWSPDGTRLAAHGPADPALITIRADLTGRVDQVVDPDGGFAWSPDSRQMAFLSEGALDLLDPAGIVPPIRISDDPALHLGCLTWDAITKP